MTRFLRNHSILIKILISIAITVVLVMRSDLHQLENLAHDIYPTAWLAAFALIFLQIIALSYRWFLLVNVNGSKIDYPDSVRITLISLIANYLFITSIGGIVVRVALAMQRGVSLTKAIAATAVDRFMTLTALIVLTIVFLPVLSNAVSPTIFHNTLAVIGVFIAACIALPFLLFKNVEKKLIFTHRKIAVCFKYMRSVATNPDLLAKILASSLLAQIAFFVAAYILTLSTGVQFSLMAFLAVLPMIAIVASLPIGYAGWGIREGAFVYGLGLIHVPYETAFIVSVQIGLISLAASLIAGIPALISDKSLFVLKGWKSLKT